MKTFTTNIDNLQRVRVGKMDTSNSSDALIPDEDEHIIPFDEDDKEGEDSQTKDQDDKGGESQTKDQDDKGREGQTKDQDGKSGNKPGSKSGNKSSGKSGGKPSGKQGLPVVDIIPSGVDTKDIKGLDGSNTKRESAPSREKIKETLRQAEEHEAILSGEKGSPGTSTSQKSGKVSIPTDFPTHTDWARLMVNMLNQTRRGSPTWGKPNTKLFAAKVGGKSILRPGIKTVKDIGKIIVAIDTSGSISRDIVSLFMSDLKKLFNTFQTSNTFRCKVVMWSDGPYDTSRDFTIKEFQQLYDWVLSAFSTGGTLINPVVEHIKALPDIRDYVGTVWFTDGQINDLKTKLPDNYNIFVINGYEAEYTKEFFNLLRKYKPSKQITIVKSSYDN